LGFTGLEEVNWEIWIFDGESDDDTDELARRLADANNRIKYFLNERRLQGLAVNQAVGEGPGEFLLWLGAHTEYPKDYLARLLETAQRAEADIVGGTLETRAGGEGYGAAVVQALTTHKFGIGDSGFRAGAKEGPADTVPFALYRRAAFERVGLFDERLVRAQDYEFNRRVKAAGGKIWLNPAITCVYYNQASFAAFLKKQISAEAPYNVYLAYLAPHAFAVRHWVTACFAAGIIGGVTWAPFNPLIAKIFLGVLALYAALAIGSSIQQAMRYRELRHVICLPIAFFLFHFLHGLGMLWGLIRILTGTALVQKTAEPWPGAGRRRAWPLPEEAAGDAGGQGS